MEKERLLKYRGQAPIRFLNDFNAGLLTADEYKLIREVSKADAWDRMDEHIANAGPEVSDDTPAPSPRPTSEEAAPLQKKEILLKKDIRITKNYFANPNDVIDVIAPLQTPPEECVYRRMFRWSYGWGRNHCRASIPLLMKTSKMKSRNTVRKALRGLLEMGHIAEYIDDTGRVDINNDGTLYIVYLPEEIDGLPDRDVIFDGGSKNEWGLNYKGGTKNNQGQKMTPTAPTHGNKGYTELGSDYEGSKNEGGSNIDRSKNNPHDGQKITGQKITPPVQMPTNKGITHGGSNSEGSKNDPIKYNKHISKNTLSPDPVKLFYTGIGQERISKVKREKGDSVLKELQKEGFSAEDIQFAIEWTLKPKNTKEKVHDFGIIPHTIGQALAAREAGQQAAESARKEEAGVRAAEEERKRLEGEIEEMRAKLSEADLMDLRERAESEIRESGKYPAEFINEPLIVTMENEILRREE